MQYLSPGPGSSFCSGSLAERMDVIQPMLDAAQQHGLIHRVIELSLLQAQALFALGKKDGSLQLLRNAVAHAERNGYLRLLDQNPILVRMLKGPIAQELSPGYIRKILEINAGVRDFYSLSLFRKFTFWHGWADRATQQPGEGCAEIDGRRTLQS